MQFSHLQTHKSFKVREIRAFSLDLTGKSRYNKTGYGKNFASAAGKTCNRQILILYT